jgi:hypothetical protein
MIRSLRRVMAKKWTDEEVQAEIRAAVQMVAEDRERARYASLHEKYGQQTDPGSSGNGGDPPGDDKTPPKKDEDPEPDLGNGKKRSLWWGEISDE